MVFNRHWPYELRYDSLHSGLSLPKLHLEQLIQHTIAIYSLYNNTETNILLINTLQLFQLQIGLSGNIFQHPRISHHGNSVWIRQWVNEMAEYNIKMFIPQTLQISPQRKNDQTIMDIITSSETKPIIIEQMNLCRQFLKIIYLSDITTADGSSISNDIINMIPNQSSYEWTIIPHPPIKLQTIWKRTLKTILCEPKTNHLLRQYQLGPWIIPPKKVILSSNTTYHPQQM